MYMEELSPTVMCAVMTTEVHVGIFAHCDVCSKDYRRKVELKEHLVNVHGVVKLQTRPPTSRKSNFILLILELHNDHYCHYNFVNLICIFQIY